MRDIVKNNRFCLILSIYIILKPLYLRASGTVQIADVFLVVAFIIALILEKGRINIFRKDSAILLPFLFLCIYQFLINLIWSIILKQMILKPTIYYVFNYFVVFVCLSIIRKCEYDQVSKVILIGCLMSLILTSIGIFLRLGGVRKLGFFNNPNQLGYYALLMLSFLFFFFKYASLLMKIAIGGLAAWALIASASKAAFVGAVVLILLFILFGDKKEKKPINKLILQIIVLIIVAGLFYFIFYSNSKIVLSNATLSFLRRRMLRLSTENDSSLSSGRGYARLFEMRGNFLWGMGEGAYTRFTSLYGKEAHSTVITLIVSYGLIGFLGYLYLFWQFVGGRKTWKNSLVILSGVFIYSIAHNGIRNSLLWVLLALIYCYKVMHTSNTAVSSKRIC